VALRELRATPRGGGDEELLMLERGESKGGIKDKPYCSLRVLRSDINLIKVSMLVRSNKIGILVDAGEVSSDAGLCWAPKRPSSSCHSALPISEKDFLAANLATSSVD
jgi:hypothetical protein